jgi:hypothetical protein
VRERKKIARRGVALRIIANRAGSRGEKIFRHEQKFW